MNVIGNLKRTVSYVQRNGVKKTVRMVRQRLSEQKADKEYRYMLADEKPECSPYRQDGDIDGSLKFSILVPAYETNELHLREMAASVELQFYDNYELIIADASISDGVKNVISEINNDKIKYIRLKENGGISANTNEALKAAEGDIIVLLDHDDLLKRGDALLYLAKSYSKGALAVYSDEDKYEEASGECYCCHRKPDFNLDLLLSNNYICHLFSVKTSVAKAVGGFRSEFDGAQDYDFILRCVNEIAKRSGDEFFENPSKYIAHVPKVLYHWRVHASSTAENPNSKLYAYEAGARSVQSYLDERALRVKVKDTDHRGFYYPDFLPDGNVKVRVKFSMPSGVQPFNKNESIDELKDRMLAFFQRPEVNTVCARCVDSRGNCLDEPYKGMKYWDSGIMHRAHLIQDVDEINSSVYAKRKDNSGYLTVYVPEIIFKL